MWFEQCCTKCINVDIRLANLDLGDERLNGFDHLFEVSVATSLQHRNLITRFHTSSFLNLCASQKHQDLYLFCSFEDLLVDEAVYELNEIATCIIESGNIREDKVQLLVVAGHNIGKESHRL